MAGFKHRDKKKLSVLEKSNIYHLLFCIFHPSTENQKLSESRRTFRTRSLKPMKQLKIINHKFLKVILLAKTH